MILWSAILETSPLETDASTPMIGVSNLRALTWARSDPSVTSTWDGSETAPNLNAIKASHQSLTKLHYLGHIKQYTITLKASSTPPHSRLYHAVLHLCPPCHCHRSSCLCGCRSPYRRRHHRQNSVHSMCHHQLNYWTLTGSS
jgi:hypothetical protein